MPQPGFEHAIPSCPRLLSLSELCYLSTDHLSSVAKRLVYTQGVFTSTTCFLDVGRRSRKTVG